MIPDWLEIVIAIVGLFGTIIGVLGISGYLSERAKYKANKRNQKEEAQEQREHEDAEVRLSNAIRGVLKEEIQPELSNISSEISEIKEDLAANTVGTVTILRDRMKAILDECRKDGFASTGTKGNWHELYSTYKSLGGNHFKEYVDA